MKTMIGLFVMILVSTTSLSYSQTNINKEPSSSIVLTQEEESKIKLQSELNNKQSKDFENVSEEVIIEIVNLRKMGVKIPSYPELITTETLVDYLEELKSLKEQSTLNEKRN